MQKTAKTIVFHDGACPLCRREIAHYQRLDRARHCEWVDINQDMTLLQAFGVPFEMAMRRLHVLYKDGRLLNGAYAFAAVWSELPYYRVLASWLRSIPGALKVMNFFYGGFANWRYQRRCQDGFCSTS
jgi:predicted DCC family thiol-disulfide oxidoreductase YuxK